MKILLTGAYAYKEPQLAQLRELGLELVMMPDERGDLSQFPDGSDTSSWALDAVGWAVATELLRGYDNTGELGPGDDLTRAQAAAVFMRQADAEKDEKTGD